MLKNLLIIISYIIIFIYLIKFLITIKNLKYFYSLKKKVEWFLSNAPKTKDEVMISSKEYKEFITLLNKYSVFVNKFNKINARKNKDIRINEYLIYRIKKIREDKKIHKVVEFHIKSDPPSILKEVIKIEECINSFVDNAVKFLSDPEICKIEGLSHNRIITNFIYSKELKPKFKEKGYTINLKEADNKYLISIYCDIILVNGVDYLFTINGCKNLKKVNKVIKFKIEKMH